MFCMVSQGWLGVKGCYRISPCSVGPEDYENGRLSNRTQRVKVLFVFENLGVVHYKSMAPFESHISAISRENFECRVSF